MSKLWVFAPALLVLFGASFVAAGSFWAAYRQANSSIVIRQKNDQIIALQQENIANVRGADFCSFGISPDETNGQGGYRLMVFSDNNLPVYDVRIYVTSGLDLSIDTEYERQRYFNAIRNPFMYDIGTLHIGEARSLDVFLKPGHYQIDIITRNARYTELIKFGPFGSGLGSSMIVREMSGKVLQSYTGPDGYPKIY